MTYHQELRFYSAMLDCEAVRVSMVDARGSEYFAIVPAASGGAWRERRDAALMEIEDAIARGDEPGEVDV